MFDYYGPLNSMRFPQAPGTLARPQVVPWRAAGGHITAQEIGGALTCFAIDKLPIDADTDWNGREKRRK